MEKIEFWELIDYAKEKGYPERKDKSKRVKDMTGRMFVTFFQTVIVLYEGEKRIVRGHDKPEVCWICMAEDGKIMSIPARQLRAATKATGFCLWNNIRRELIKRRDIYGL